MVDRGHIVTGDDPLSDLAQGDPDDVALRKLAQHGVLQVALEPPRHHLVERLRTGLHRHAAREALRIQELQQCGGRV